MGMLHFVIWDITGKNYEDYKNNIFKKAMYYYIGLASLFYLVLWFFISQTILTIMWLIERFFSLREPDDFKFDCVMLDPLWK